MYKAIKITGDEQNTQVLLESVGSHSALSERFKARVDNNIGCFVVLREFHDVMIYDGVQDAKTLKTIFNNVDEVTGDSFLKLEYHG